jgi:hypothetical protein
MKNNQDIITTDSYQTSPAGERVHGRDAESFVKTSPCPLVESNRTASVRVTPKLDNNQISSPVSSTIHPQHSKELAESAIDPLIAELNFVSLQGVAPYEYLFYSDAIKRLNTGRLPSWILKKYSHIEMGGWWSSGIDPLTFEEELWGCFKPNQPRLDPTKGKYQKYEHPLKAVATLFALRVPLNIWQKVSKRYSVPLPDNVVVDTKGEALGFWAWVIANPKVAVILTEGVKKAAALLSQGFVAIGLPGIWGGYRSQGRSDAETGRQGESSYKGFQSPHARGSTRGDSKSQRKTKGSDCPRVFEKGDSPYLLPQLAVFACEGRQFYFAFDQDEKPTTRLHNRKAVGCTARLLQQHGSVVSIISWLPWIKGCDDLIVAKGANYFEQCYSKALSFDDWQADALKELTYKPAVRFDSQTKYIGEFAPPPDAKLICLKAPKGSGKTEALVKVCAEAQNRGQKVLVITHRQQLGQALCSRFGIDYVSGT